MERSKAPASAILRFVNNWRAKYIFGNAQIAPPKNADNARLGLATNKNAAIQNVISHCQTRM